MGLFRFCLHSGGSILVELKDISEAYEILDKVKILKLCQASDNKEWILNTTNVWAVRPSSQTKEEILDLGKNYHKILK